MDVDGRRPHGSTCTNHQHQIDSSGVEPSVYPSSCGLGSLFSEPNDSGTEQRSALWAVWERRDWDWREGETCIGDGPVIRYGKGGEDGIVEVIGFGVSALRAAALEIEQ